MNKTNLVIGGIQEHQSVRSDGICSCLTSSMGTGGGNIPYITEEIHFSSNGCVDCDNCNHRSEDCLCDISNNDEECPLIPKIKIRQATKDGFVECELPGIADLNYTSSKTRRGRVVEGGADKPYFNNGEYP